MPSCTGRHTSKYVKSTCPAKIRPLVRHSGAQHFAVTKDCCQECLHEPASTLFWCYCWWSLHKTYKTSLISRQQWCSSAIEQCKCKQEQTLVWMTKFDMLCLLYLLQKKRNRRVHVECRVSLIAGLFICVIHNWQNQAGTLLTGRLPHRCI